METSKDITEIFFLNILNVIGKAITEENYLKIYCAETYLSSQHQ